MTADRLQRWLDRLGWLEAAAIGIGVAAVLGLQVAQLVRSIRDEQTPSPTSWAIAAGVAAAVAAVTMLLVAWEWRRHGGRQLQRLGRRVWLTGRLPQELSLRFAVLRDLERRQQKLERSWLPAWILAVFWVVVITGDLLSHPSATEAVTGAALLALLLFTGAVDVVDRRMRPRLRRLITELRQNPVPAAVVRVQ